MDHFRREVQHWNQFTFGNIFERKRRCRARLAGVQRVRAIRDSRYLTALEGELLTEYNQILVQEELFWQQKSLISWLQAGEQNTRFFHTSTLLRRRRNRICRLKDPSRVWCDESPQLQAMATRFYEQLYTSEPTSSPSPVPLRFPTLSHSDRQWLNRLVSELEIQSALFQMGSHKAPGPDGFSVLFFQKYWPVVKPQVLSLLGGVFSTGQFPIGLNASIICLIPKCDAPEDLHQFRPISLCNVLVKVVTKVLSNRLQPLMATLTGPCQTSFIPGRSTVDNIIVVQEAVHTLSKRKGSKGGFILKVDLEKAYDRVEWTFLDRVLPVTGFSSTFYALIRHCISSTSLAVCWNGEFLPSFTPLRGLRQGDPLSTYLFVLCMEVLGQSIQQAIDRNAWRPVRLARQGPVLSHIFFADDLLLFGEASFSQARLMEHLLADFCGLSGQRVNRSKSRVWFSPNTPSYLRNSICSEFHVTATSDLGCYLGVPIIHGRLWRRHYHYLVAKTQSRLAAWKVRLLSKEARSILLSSTLMSFPLYSMQTATIPRVILSQLERLSRQFFWGEELGTRRLHTIAWPEICKAKCYGGLGFPSFSVVNDAFLAKLLWRMVRTPTALSSRIFLGKYGGWRSLLLRSKVTGTSHIWRAMHCVFPLLHVGLHWIIGNGSSISFWLDRWLGDQPLLLHCTSELPHALRSATVADFWCPRQGWKFLTFACFLPPFVLQLFSRVSPCSDDTAHDTPRWIHTIVGLFSVSSARQ